jgi:glycosyltransferase involved in cell wall biosynthesis
MVLFPVFLMRISLLRKSVFYLLNQVSRKNKLIIEVNDLPYEQSIDLELAVHDIHRVLQDGFYTVKRCHYIFASNEMASYIASKYSIEPMYSNVIINGAPQLCDYSSVFTKEEWMHSTKTKFVYAGSLNKGRQIEDLLDVFSENEANLLIVLGNEGEWLKEIQLPKNIIYLGNFEENEAHYLVSKCDIGIIPYNADRFYYNLCFPTKVSFYLTAGLPILSTPLKELQQVFKNEGIVLFVPFADWKSILPNISKKEVAIMKESVQMIKESYSWKTLLNKNKFD